MAEEKTKDKAEKESKLNLYFAVLRRFFHNYSEIFAFLKYTLWYMGFIMLVHIGSTIVYQNVGSKEIDFKVVLLSLFLKKYADVAFDNLDKFVIACDAFLNAVAFAIYTGKLVALFLTRKPKTVFQKKFIIRHAGHNIRSNIILLGVLVGSPSSRTIYDVTCTMYFHYKREDRKNTREIRTKVALLDTYYRFNFPISELTPDFLEQIKDFLEYKKARDYEHRQESEEAAKERMERYDGFSVDIVLSGYAAQYRTPFTVEHRYLLKDLCFCEKGEDYKTEKTVLGKTKRKFDKKKFNHICESDIDHVNDILKKLDKVINQKIAESKHISKPNPQKKSGCFIFRKLRRA